jgi:hypothetical protein
MGMGKTLQGRRPVPAAQLDREIAQALARKRPRRHHATRYRMPYDDAWDVALDAILEHDPKRAAQIVKDIRAKHGSYEPSDEFEKALDKVPSTIRQQFEDHMGLRTAAKHIEAIKDAINRTNGGEALIAAVREAKKHRAWAQRTVVVREFDPKLYDLGNLLVATEELVRRYKIYRKTGRYPKATSSTAWRTRGI